MAADAVSQRAFRQTDDAVSVQTPDGNYEPVQPPAGFTVSAFKGTLAAFNTAYRQYGRIPTLDEVHPLWPRYPKASMGEIMVTPEFTQALIYRGIEPVENMGLSRLQHAVLMKMADPLDGRSAAAKLRELGVTPAQYTNWKRYAPFARALDEQSKRLYTETLPDVRNRLVNKALAGDMRAVELVMDKTGESPKAQELQDVKQVVLTLVEAVQRHCTTEQRLAILADVQLVLTALNVSPGELTA